MSQSNGKTATSETQETSFLGQLITQQVDDSEKERFFPGMYGKYYMLAQDYLYFWMRQHTRNWSGGYWRFHHVMAAGTDAVLSGYVFPLTEEGITVQISSNYYQGEMTAQAVGITAMLFAFNHVAWIAYENNADDPIIHSLNEKYVCLKNFALTLPEAVQIFRAID